MEELLILGAAVFVLWTVIKAHQKVTVVQSGQQPNASAGAMIVPSDNGSLVSGSTSLTVATTVNQ